METLTDFVTLVTDELGLPVTVDNVSAALDAVPGWDSLHLITLLSLLERETHRSISLPDMLGAGSLRDIYDLVVAE